MFYYKNIAVWSVPEYDTIAKSDGGFIVLQHRRPGVISGYVPGYWIGVNAGRVAIQYRDYGGADVYVGDWGIGIHASSYASRYDATTRPRCQCAPRRGNTIIQIGTLDICSCDFVARFLVC